jgi:phosphonate transport system permease protein
MGESAAPEARDDPSLAFRRFEATHRRLVLRRRFSTAAILLVLLGAVALGADIGKIDPAHLAAGYPHMRNYAWQLLPTIDWRHPIASVAEWYWAFGRWLLLLGDTVLTAIVGTSLGTAAALLLSFPASRNLMGGPWIYMIVRRFLELTRTVPYLVYALIFVYAFGLGPLAGVLAIAVHTTGALGKLFSEVNESADMRPIDGVLATGASWPQMLRLAIIPQVLPTFISYTLWHLEINVRQATVLGIVGGGGIGEELYVVIRQFEYSDISAIVLLILIVVSAMDMICEAVRRRVIGGDARLEVLT